MKTFKIDMFDDHLIFEYNGQKVLVDTGCPITICRQNTFDFMGKVYTCHTSFAGRDLESISQLMNYDIDVFMGMDIIENFYVLTDYKNQQVTFSKKPIPFEPSASIPIIRGLMGEVFVNLTIKGKIAKLALDTGAKISYIDDSFTKEETAKGTKNDFSPLIGHFQTHIFELESTLGEQAFPVNFGNLPQTLAMPLKLMGIAGAIGFDLFNTYTVLMDFKSNTLSIR
jgi:hypothetical protein